MAMSRNYPCDGPDGRCPHITDERQATGTYFCYNHCGWGANNDNLYIGDDDLETLADQVYSIEHPECIEHQWITTGYASEDGTEILECAICGRLVVVHMV